MGHVHVKRFSGRRVPSRTLRTYAAVSGDLASGHNQEARVLLMCRESRDACRQKY